MLHQLILMWMHILFYNELRLCFRNLRNQRACWRRWDLCQVHEHTLCPVAGMVNREGRGLPQDERNTVIGSYQLIIIHKFLHTLQFVKTLTLYTFVINSAD